VRRLDDTYWTGAGIYLEPGLASPTPFAAQAPVSIKNTDELVNFVQRAKA
jgi:hypothetical protein